MKQLKKIIVHDPQHDSILEEQELRREKAPIKRRFLEKWFADVADYDSTILDQIISAELIFTFSRKPKEISKEDYMNALSAYMKPISDTDNVTVYPKKGKAMKASEVLMSKEIEVEKVDNYNISEQQLKQEMEMYLAEVRNE